MQLLNRKNDIICPNGKTIYLLLGCLFLSLFSCHKKETEKERLTRLITEWQGKEIVFPEEIVFTRYATDTVDWQIPESDYKVLVYVDTTGCTSCKLQLHKWKEWKEQVDSLTGGSVPFLFFFHPKDQKEIKYLLKRDAFDLPICIDKEDKLHKKNLFPSDMTFQTFLLDKNNRVVVLGNPIHNLAVKDLYLRQMTGQEKPKTDTSNTTAIAEQTEIDLGEIKTGETETALFTIRNTGDFPLVIVDAITTCGCAKVTFDKHPIQPENTLQVRVAMTPDKEGFFSETITVKCNTDSWIKLTIKGRAL